jgi:predicted RNA-binding protein
VEIFLICLVIANLIIILEMQSRNKRLKRSLEETLIAVEKVVSNEITFTHKEYLENVLSVGWNNYFKN